MTSVFYRTRAAPARVRDEGLKTFAARVPSRGCELMRDTGILAITYPELMDQVGCEQNRYHAYDVWGHTMACMDACEQGPIHRLAGLLHDVGKPKTRELSDKTGDYTFYNHEVVGARMAEGWLKRYRFSNDERQEVVHLVRHHLVCYEDSWSDAAVRRFIKRVGLDRVPALLALARADVLAKGREVGEELAALERLQARVDSAVDQGAAFGVRDLAIGGTDVMKRLGVPPGPIIGDVLEKLLVRVLDDPALNERDRLLDAVDEIGQEMHRS